MDTRLFLFLYDKKVFRYRGNGKDEYFFAELPLGFIFGAMWFILLFFAGITSSGVGFFWSWGGDLSQP